VRHDRSPVRSAASLEPSFLPTLADDETLYSLGCRYHLLSGCGDARLSSRRLLGHDFGGAQIDYVCGLRHLSEVSGGRIPADASTLRRRTVLGAYWPFMSAERKAAVLETCLGRSEERFQRSAAGLTWSSFLKMHELRGCARCDDESRTELGFSFWHISHQLPGVWVCTKHREPLRFARKRGKRNAGWVQPGSSELAITHGHLSDSCLETIHRLAVCAQWISSLEAAQLDALDTLVRSRWRTAGLISRERQASVSELREIWADRFAELSASGVPHFEQLSGFRWMRETLRDHRAAHPLKWALLLSSAGAVDGESLRRGYWEALTRLPHADLFIDRYPQQVAKAPADLYEAFDVPRTVAEAARHTGRRSSEVSSWLRRDPALSLHRDESSRSIKARAAVFVIRGAMAADPARLRINVLRRARWGVSWLEKNEPGVLQGLMPPAYGKQRSLNF
jgi:hypothetical protein